MSTQSQNLQAASEVEPLLQIMPPHIQRAANNAGDFQNLIEIVLDLGRLPEARYASGLIQLSDIAVSRQDLDYVLGRVGTFTQDNRAGIERTLHRISAMRNRKGNIIGLTCRVGRAVFGTVDIVRDVIEQGSSLLLLGRPGVGKTTLLRESARVLAEEFGKRVIIVDTSNEIGGDGDVPHPGIGRARRMQVPSPDRQHAVMIEAVENHMPEVIVIDEIGTQAEAQAARTIAERGVQLIATAHGNTLDNLVQNPTLSDLLGGIQAVTLSDEEAKRRRSRKSVLERKAQPTFQVLVEIQSKDRLVIHSHLDQVVDELLTGADLEPEIRFRTTEGEIQVEQAPFNSTAGSATGPFTEPLESSSQFAPRRRMLRIFPYGVNRDRLEKAIQKLGAPAVIVRDLEAADSIVTQKSHEKKQSRRLRQMQDSGVPLHVVRNNTLTQMEHFLRSILDLQGDQQQELEAVQAAEEAVSEAFQKGLAVELTPQNSYLRSLQHQIAERYGLVSESKGREPRRRVVIYPL
ncbi:MAG: R3H domain-containing nucleic acid-binding protein [Thermodesulfobacteriota bacterium]